MTNYPSLEQLSRLLKNAADLREQMSVQLHDPQPSDWLQDIVAVHHALLEAEQTLAGQLSQLLSEEGSSGECKSAKYTAKPDVSENPSDLRAPSSEDTHNNPSCMRGSFRSIKYVIQCLRDISSEMRDLITAGSNNQDMFKSNCCIIDAQLHILRECMTVDDSLKERLAYADDSRGRRQAEEVAQILQRGQQCVENIASLNQSIHKLASDPGQYKLRIVSECNKVIDKCKELEKMCCCDLLHRLHKEA